MTTISHQQLIHGLIRVGSHAPCGEVAVAGIAHQQALAGQLPRSNSLFLLHADFTEMLKSSGKGVFQQNYDGKLTIKPDLLFHYSS